MRLRKYLPRTAWAAAALAALMGCQGQPPVVVSDLPGDSILHGGTGRGQAGPRRTGRAPGEGGWAPQAHERPWRYIVVHHSATESGSAEVFDRMHRQRGWDGLGYHFVIDNGLGAADGLVEVGSRWTRQKWGAHTGGTPANEYNNYGIGVCLVGDCTGDLPTQAQLASLRRLLAFLMDRYDIPPERVIGHRDAPGADTECPGDRLYRYLNEVLRPELARGR